MTRFAGEPHPETKARQGVWGVQDLRERPAPLMGGEVHYAMIASELNQTDPLEPDDERGFEISPPTDGYSSDPSVLEPVDTGVPGIRVKAAGFVIATARVIGWDDYTGVGTNVQDAVKGCSPVWDGGDYLGVVFSLSNFASAQSAAANVGDNQTALTDSAIITSTSQRVSIIAIQSSPVDAAFIALELYVAWLAAYPGANDQVYTF